MHVLSVLSACTKRSSACGEILDIIKHKGI